MCLHVTIAMMQLTLRTCHIVRRVEVLLQAWACLKDFLAQMAVDTASIVMGSLMHATMAAGDERLVANGTLVWTLAWLLSTMSQPTSNSVHTCNKLKGKG
jgi:hypothetical protein